MSAETTPTRERSALQLEVEVPGTPEEVWEAIVTGPGTREEWPGLDGGPRSGLVAEWLVEPVAAGGCVVRVVAADDDGTPIRGERELQSTRESLALVLHNLWLHRTYFPEQRYSPVSASAVVAGPLRRAWSDLAEALGVGYAAAGEPIRALAPGGPALHGLVERKMRGEHHAGLTLLLDDPAPGFALVFVDSHRGAVFANVRAYLFEDDAESAAARAEPAWRTWLGRRSPAFR